MIAAITADEKLTHINSMLSEISNIYQRLLLVKNVPESVFIVMSSILELGEGCLQKNIAEKSYISKKTVNSTIKKLQKDAYIELKAGKYPNMHIYLTDKGRDYVEENITPIIELENNVLKNMNNSEFDSLIVIYQKYIGAFREYVEEFALRNGS
ncbi:MAG: MarR family winged helix-turn-helix transcriptional regulator [Candidatus Gastranaerophilales bacterium]|nr:MarR family winged helix-turn-helix transcriptional regulator [Candidatus Gastranaerophilales bacterium]